MDEEGVRVPGEDATPALPPVQTLAARLPRDRYTSQMWLSLASYMVGSAWSEQRISDVAAEVERRLETMDCGYGQAIASIWDDIKAGRWRPRDH